MALPPGAAAVAQAERRSPALCWRPPDVGGNLDHCSAFTVEEKTPDLVGFGRIESQVPNSPRLSDDEGLPVTFCIATMILSVLRGAAAGRRPQTDTISTPMRNHDSTPIEATILVDYQVIDGWHVFTSTQVKGLYVAHPDQRMAYDAIGPTIEKLLAENERVLATVSPALTFDAFLERVRQHVEMPKILPGIPQPFMVRASAS